MSICRSDVPTSDPSCIVGATIHDLHEKKVMPSQAGKQGLALYIGDSNDGRTTIYMLYDAKRLLETAVNALDDAFVRNYINRHRLFNPHVFAMMSVRPRISGAAWNAAEVKLAAARHGYGPLLYDIAMANEGGLMADRESVSSAAKNVWQYYLHSRRDVIAKPLDDEHDPKTEPTIDDAELHDDWIEDEDNPLNYAYFIRRKPNISKLTANHNDVVKKLRREDIEVNFSSVALSFWQTV